MMIKEIELVESFRDLNLGVTLTPCSIRLNQIKVTSDFKDQITRSQREDEEFLKIVTQVKEGKLKGFAQDVKGVWRYQGRICVLVGGNLKNMIIEEAHKGHFTMHPDSTKMYQDLKRMFWWPGMTKDVMDMVNKCLVC